MATRFTDEDQSLTGLASRLNPMSYVAKSVGSMAGMGDVINSGGLAKQTGRAISPSGIPYQRGSEQYGPPAPKSAVPSTQAPTGTTGKLPIGTMIPGNSMPWQGTNNPPSYSTPPSAISSAVDTGVNKWKQTIGQAAAEMQNPMFTNRQGVYPNAFVQGENGNYSRGGQEFGFGGGSPDPNLASIVGRVPTAAQFANNYMDASGNRFDGGGSALPPGGNNGYSGQYVETFGGRIPIELQRQREAEGQRMRQESQINQLMAERFNPEQVTYDRWGSPISKTPGGEASMAALGHLISGRNAELGLQGESMRDLTTRRGQDIGQNTSFAQIQAELQRERMGNEASTRNALIGERGVRYGVDQRGETAQGAQSIAAQRNMIAREKALETRGTELYKAYLSGDITPEQYAAEQQKLDAYGAGVGSPSPQGQTPPPPGAVKMRKSKSTGRVEYLDANGNVIGG